MALWELKRVEHFRGRSWLVSKVMDLTTAKETAAVDLIERRLRSRDGFISP